MSREHRASICEFFDDDAGYDDKNGDDSTKAEVEWVENEYLDDEDSDL